MPHNCVASAFSILNFAQDKLAHKLKNEPDKGLTVEFILFLVCLFWCSSENVVDALHKLVHATCTKVTNKIQYLDIVLCEVQNGKGRSDAVVWQKDAIYIFEFKMDGSAKEALEQINSQNYPIAYKNDGRKIVKVDAILEDNSFDGILSQKTLNRISGLENRTYSIRELDDIFPDN